MQKPSYSHLGNQRYSAELIALSHCFWKEATIKKNNKIWRDFESLFTLMIDAILGQGLRFVK